MIQESKKRTTMQYLVYVWQRIWNWFSAWRTIHQTNRWMQTLETKVNKVLKERQKSERELQNLRSENSNLQERFTENFKKQSQVIARSDGLNKKLEETVQALMDQIKTSNELTIPALVSSHQVLISRWESQAQIEMIRQVAARKDVE